MNLISRILTGSVATGLGLVLIVIALIESLWILSYGIPILIIGLIIFFNKREDDIEKVKFQRKGGDKNG